jgi:pimeloyl-ACP methyl ester carboxylesterase
MVGDQADDGFREVADTIGSVPAATLAWRIRSVLSLDETQAFLQCSVPTLYLRITDDRLVPDSAWRKMSRLRQIEVALVPGPHLLLQTNSTAAWDAILLFLESLRPAEESAT